MNNILLDELSCNVNYKKGYIDYEVIKLNDIKKEIKYFKNTNTYFSYIIDYIKNNVIKHYPNLNLVKIQLNIFDKNNIIHRFIIKISNMIQDILNYKEKIFLCKSIIIYITYENKIIFAGLI
jgi:hypothetical protein